MCPITRQTPSNMRLNYFYDYITCPLPTLNKLSAILTPSAPINSLIKRNYFIWSYTLFLREESRLRVLENRILRRIFGPNRDENGEWRRLHNEELHSLHRAPNIVRVIKSRRLRWAGHVARMEEEIGRAHV